MFANPTYPLRARFRTLLDLVIEVLTLGEYRLEPPARGGSGVGACLGEGRTTAPTGGSGERRPVCVDPGVAASTAPQADRLRLRRGPR